MPLEELLRPLEPFSYMTFRAIGFLNNNWTTLLKQEKEALRDPVEFLSVSETESSFTTGYGLWLSTNQGK